MKQPEASSCTKLGRRMESWPIGICQHRPG